MDLMPRLAKGEVASGVKAKAIASEASAKRRIELFESLKLETSPSENKIMIFANVSSLAAWDEPLSGVTPLSQKTLRKYINIYYPSGLSGLTKEAGLMLQGAKVAVSTVTAEKYVGLQSRVEQAVDSALEMTARYLDLLERMKKLAVQDERAEMEMQRHFRRYETHPHMKVVK